MNETTVKILTILYLIAGGVFCAVFGVDTELFVKLSFITVAICVGISVLWKYVLYPIVRFGFIVAFGIKAGKGIIEEVRKGK